MTRVLNLTASRHESRVLSSWLAGRSGAAQRAGVTLRNDVLSSDAAGMLELFRPVNTSSGYAVTDQTSMLVTTVYACLSKLGGVVLQLPLHQYRLGLAAGRERVLPPSKLWWMLNESPTAAWTAASWKEWIVRCVHLRGDQVTEIIRDPRPSQAGAPIALLPHHPDLVNIRRYVHHDTGEPRLAYDLHDINTGALHTVDQDDVLHFTGFGFDGRRSISVIQHAARNAVGNSLAASDFMGKSIGQGAMPKIALTVPGKLDKTQADQLRESFVATYGSGPTQQRLPLVLTEGGTAAPLTISPVDMQLLESRQLDAQQICEACGVPPIILGNSDKTSSWGTGVEQITIGFVKFTVKPHLARWEEELNRKLFRRAGQFVEFELDALLRGDSKAQADAFRLALGGPGSGDGWMSVNEVRKLKNLPAYPDAEYDKPFRAQRGTVAKPPPEPPNDGATA